VLIKDKTAVITGSNRGIGLKTLEIFSENGANIIACTRKIDKNFLDNIKNLKNRMIYSIAKLCKISQDRINIKGKTTEKLGVIGKEKAIACEVIASVSKYDE